MTQRPSLAVRPGALTEEDTDMLALLVTPEGFTAAESGVLSALDSALDGHLLATARAEGFEGKAGERFVLHTMGRLTPRRVALVGVGDLEPARRRVEGVRVAAASAARCASGARCESLSIALVGEIEGVEARALSEHLLLGAALGAYRYDLYKTSEDAPRGTLKRIALLADHQELTSRVQALAEAICFARDLGNAPPNEQIPASLAAHAEAIAASTGMSCEVFEEDELQRRGMNLLYAVGKGSVNGPRLIHLKYTPEGESLGRISIIGKGVTFDTGGYSLKPPKSLLNMQLDMGGSAAVLGAAQAIGRLGCRWTVDFIVASAENCVSDRAYKPMDVIRGYGGKTVEITNTDAEGRLCMADALAYAAEFEPDYIMDLATLTGACLVALGEDTAAAFGSDDAFTQAVVEAGRTVGESMWHMPLNESLRGKLKSPIADTRNSAVSPWGGAITAALFLKLWVGDLPWVHLDIAGPGMGDSDTTINLPGGTGFGVATLVELLGRLEPRAS